MAAGDIRGAVILNWDLALFVWIFIVVVGISCLDKVKFWLD